MKWKERSGDRCDEDGNLVYQLINGNGNIKEFHYDGELKFEGDYLNGKRNLKGKEYHLSGNLRFEGEYSYGKRSGKGKEYNHHGKLIFENDYLMIKEMEKEKNLIKMVV